MTPVFAQIDGYVSLRQNGPSNYTSDRSSKRPVATGLGPVFQISQNPGNRNRTDHQRAWTATAVQSFFGPVQFGLRSFCGPRTGLLNTTGHGLVVSDREADITEGSAIANAYGEWRLIDLNTILIPLVTRCN